jgi:hypothetical protein
MGLLGITDQTLIKYVQVRPVTCWHLLGFLHWFEVYSTDSSKKISTSQEVLNFNQLSVKLNRFIWNWWSVLPAHWEQIIDNLIRSIKSDSKFSSASLWTKFMLNFSFQPQSMCFRSKALYLLNFGKSHKPISQLPRTWSTQKMRYIVLRGRGPHVLRIYSKCLAVNQMYSK